MNKILITQDVYDHMIKLKIQEECGFIFANNDLIFDSFFKVKNVSKNKNTFRMSFFGKAIAILWAFINKKKDLCIFHVHNVCQYPSIVDLEQSIPDLLYVIYCIKNKTLFFFKKIKNKNLQFESIDWEISK